jgi:glycine hydroxymethyltransferase
MSELLDSSVMPGMQGGPLMHIISAKAIAFGEALKEDFKKYAQKIVDNAKTMANSLMELDYDLVSKGTDTHVVLIDLTNKNISGKEAEKVLEAAGITVNKNMVPFDQRSPFVTSGIRIGTPAITTRDMGKEEMKEIVRMIDSIIRDSKNIENIHQVKAEVKNLCESYPIYKELAQ